MSTFKDQGNAAFKAKNFEEAIGFYTQAIEENPSDHTIYGNRSAAYYTLKKYDEALGDADKCIEIKDDWSKGYQRRAMALQAKGDLDTAIENYRIGCEKDPNNAQCRSMLDAAEE